MTTLRRGLFLVTVVSLLGLGSIKADQPHMRRALQHLQAARAELERAQHNKGGFRVRALRNVNQAITDTQNGIKAGQ